MTIVSDEWRSATWAEDAAQRTWALATSTLTGVRHVVADRIVARPALAKFLVDKLAIGAELSYESRDVRKAPHLGKVDLRTRFDDALAAPLPSVMPLE